MLFHVFKTRSPDGHRRRHVTISGGDADYSDGDQNGRHVGGRGEQNQQGSGVCRVDLSLGQPKADAGTSIGRTVWVRAGLLENGV